LRTDRFIKEVYSEYKMEDLSIFLGKRVRIAKTQHLKGMLFKFILSMGRFNDGKI